MGSQGARHTQQLLAALHAAIPSNATLHAIILTHAHPDHIGALPLLLYAFPGARVYAHENEGPFLRGEQSYTPTTGLGARLGRWVGFLLAEAVQVPAARLHLLEEPLSDLSDAGFEGLVCIATPGHTPGHISVLHSAASGSGPSALLAGDAVSFIKPQLSWASAKDAQDPRVIGTFAGLTLRAMPTTLCLEQCDPNKAQTSACMLADGMRYDRVLASHDWAGRGRGGWTRDGMQAFAASNPRCRELAQMAAQGGSEEDSDAEYQVEEGDDQRG